MLRSIIVEREPIYRHQDIVDGFAPTLFGISTSQADLLNDDQLGRSLDQIFLADRGTLLTEIVVNAAQRFDLRMDQLHNPKLLLSNGCVERCSIRSRKAIRS